MYNKGLKIINEKRKEKMTLFEDIVTCLISL